LEENIPNTSFGDFFNLKVYNSGSKCNAEKKKEKETLSSSTHGVQGFFCADN